MYSKFKIRSIAPSLIIAAIAAFLMGSCTVYRYADPAQGDGIYSTQGNYREIYRGEAENYQQTSNYYKQYFQSKKGSYAALLVNEDEQSALFTDVDAYHSRDYIGEDGYVYTENIEQEQAYAGWGNNPTSVTINMYESGYGGYYSPWAYNTFYGNWGYPYYRYGFRPWGIGIGIGWGYGHGWGYGYGWGGGFWGGGYYNPYYGYGHHYYPSYPSYNNNVSYNRGRRNSDYTGRGNYSGQTNINRGRESNSGSVGRGNSGSSSRESSIISSGRRDASINRGGRVNTNTTYDRSGATQTARRANFPGSNTSAPNRVEQQRPTRRQPVNTNTRPTQNRQNPVYNNTQNRNPIYNNNSQNRSSNMRSSSPTRSSSNMQSSPSRGSSAPARSSSGSGSRGRR